MAKQTSRPGRTLLVFFIVVGVLYGLAALGGTWKPRLGLDLEGGTRITLSAISGVNSTKLDQAAGIIDARVNGSGVSEAEVTTQGNRNIVVEVPAKNTKSLVDSVKRTAQLRFRLVYGQGTPGLPVTSTPTATPSGTPTTTPSGTTTPEPSESATPAPRVAPQLAPASDHTTSPTPTPTPSPTPTPTPTAPAEQGDGAPVDDALAWASNPGSEWIAKYQAFTCPPPGEDSAPIADDPDQPLITCDENGLKYLLSKAVIEGTSLKSASAGIPQGSSAWAVMLRLKGDARKTFADISRALFNNGGQFSIVLDGKVISAPGFEGVITDGNAQITGSFTQDEATSLANSLKYGALPVRFDPEVRVEVVGPSLAGSQLSAGILAGGIGLAIVMIYCLFYYRGLGIVVVLSLFVAAGVIYATALVLAKTAGFTLTLPGIAGLIVAVGITADSFIVYFERIRDEMRAGKSMRVAVETGWVRARNTCLAADAVSLLAAVVLYIFAIGVVRGFAFALGLSTLIDVAVFFWFTKPTVSLLARRPYFNAGKRFSGLSPETLGIDGRQLAPTQLAGGRA